MRVPWLLVGRHLRAHWLRSGLTMLALTVAMFLFCALVSLVTTMDSVVKQAATNRLIPQSAVSLFVALPLDYQAKIEAVPGVEAVTKFQWFGGYYKERENFLGEFGIDHDRFFDMYRNDVALTKVLAPDGTVLEARRDADGEPLAHDPELVAAAIEAMKADRRAAIVGEGLATDKVYEWKLGQTVPLISPFFVKNDQSAWDFTVVGFYRPLKSNMDDRTMWFRFDYLDEMLASGEAQGQRGVGVFSVNVAPGHDPQQVIADIDALFANGPQRTITTTEAAFQAGFVSMMGNLPFFVGMIGGAVVFAVVFSVINTMLMSGRQRLHETGILKALGFSDGALAWLMLGESFTLSLIGGGAGILLALVSAEGMRKGLGAFLPNYHVEPRTALFALGVVAAIGIVAGITPAIMAARLRPTAALRSEG
jgi:putative ABC transport system permease protein